MIIARRLLPFAWLLLFACSAQALPERAERVAREAELRAKLLDSENIATITMRWSEHSEAKPPQMTFYVLAERLLAVRIRVGHETWFTETSYLFDDEERPIKYERVNGGVRAGEPAEVVLFGGAGDIVYRSGREPTVDAASLVDLYRRLVNLRGTISRY